MIRTKEVLEYEKHFEEEVFEILAVTGANGFGGGKTPKEEYWTASISLTAWKRVGSEAATEGAFLLSAKADDAYLNVLRKAAKPDQIIRARVRRWDNRFLIMELPEPAQDARLAEILEEQTRVVTLEDKLLGTFTLNRNVNWFETEVLWMGKKVGLSFDADEDEIMEDERLTGRTLVQDQARWDRRVRAAAAELLELKNDTWLGDDEAEVTAEEFQERIFLQSISVMPEGEFEFWFADDDLFWGHSIIVSGNLEEGPVSADIAG